MHPQSPWPAAHFGVPHVVVFVGGGGGGGEEEEEADGAAGGGSLGGGGSSVDGLPGGAPGFSGSLVALESSPRARWIFTTDGSAPPEHAATRIPTVRANKTRMFHCRFSKRCASKRADAIPRNSSVAALRPGRMSIRIMVIALNGARAGRNGEVMNRLAEPDPFAPSAPLAFHTEEELETRWFAAARRPSIRPTRPPPRAPIDDPVADTWFR